jgi:hypothetical protein
MLPTTTIGRNLPSWALDIIAHGIEDDADDRRPLFKATHDVACAAVRHGWTEQDFLNILMEGVKDGGPKPAKGLWEQLNYRRHRPLSVQTVMTFVRKAWTWAVDNIAKGRRPAQELESDLLAVAEHWAKTIANPRYLFTRSEMLVLDYVVTETVRRKYRNVTCPVRAVAEYTGLSIGASYEALGSLTDLGILDRISRGTWRGLRKNHGGKAAIYRLADPVRLQGAPTLPHEKPSDQHLPSTGEHIPQLQGADMYTSSSLNREKSVTTPSKPPSQTAIAWLKQQGCSIPPGMYDS